MSSWIKLTDAVRSGRIHQIMYWGSAGANQRASFQVNNGKLKLELAGPTSVTSTKNVVDGWHHVAVTYNGTTGQLYIDGVAENSAVMSPNLTANSPGIGFNPASPTAETALGKIDEVRLYSRALTATEIKKLAVKVPGGLVVQYPLDNSGIENSGNNFDLTLINSPAAATDRYSSTSSALTFNASTTYGSVADNATMRFISGNSITLAGWINPSGSGTQRTVIAKGRTAGSDNANYVLRCLQVGDLLNFYFHSGGSLKEYRSSSAVCNTATWMHVAVTYQFGNAATAQLYLNGLAIPGSWTSGTGNESPDSPTDPLFVGAVNGGSLQHVFSGQLDDVRIYNRALTAGEVAALATELDRGLVAYYPLDEASSASVKDYSGSGYDGVGQGATGSQNTPQPITINRFGTNQTAMNFDGTDDSIEMSSGDTFAKLPSGTALRTVCAWQQLTTGYDISYGTEAGSQRYGLRDNRLAFNGIYLDLAIAKGTSWNHICTAYDGTNAHIYVNGILNISGARAINTINSILRIGSGVEAGAFATGVVDDVRIYNRLLSVAEIRAMSGFFPAHVADVKIWLDASRIGVTGVNSGDDLDTWKDLSGNGFDASKGTGGAGAKPNWYTGIINSLPAVHYASGEDHDLAKGPYNRNLNTTPHTELMVFQASGGGNLVEQNNVAFYRYNTGPVLQTGIGGVNTTSNTPYTNNTFTIGGFTYSNPSGTFYRNGAADGTFSQVAASNTNGWKLGGNSLVGDIAEFVTYDRVLTAAALEKVNCYYNKKYAIAVTGLVCE